MKHELNSQNTKQMLCDALIDLSAKKPFSKITVSEIVNLCELNRKTFYYHFTDIYDLLEWHLNNEIHASISAFDSVYNLDTTITYAVNYMNQHSYLKKIIQGPLAKEKITNLLKKILSPILSDMIEDLETTHKKSLEHDFKEFLVKNLTRITVLSILDAIENPNNYDIEKMKQYVSVIFNMSVNSFFHQI